MLGRATVATIAREAQAPAQKWGPAPKAMLFDTSRVMLNFSGSVKKLILL